MVMYGWSCLVVWSCQMLCLFWDIFREYIRCTSNKKCQMLCLFWDIFREYIRLAQATKTSLRPFWTSFVCLGTYSMNIRLTIKNSHTTLRCREYFDWTQLSHLQQLQSQNLSQQLSQKLINSHTYLATKHCSSHSHTISAAHLHIIMSGKGLLTL